jgi:hypothetical protein
VTDDVVEEEAPEPIPKKQEIKPLFNFKSITELSQF